MEASAQPEPPPSPHAHEDALLGELGFQQVGAGRGGVVDIASGKRAYAREWAALPPEDKREALQLSMDGLAAAAEALPADPATRRRALPDEETVLRVQASVLRLLESATEDTSEDEGGKAAQGKAAAEEKRHLLVYLEEPRLADVFVLSVLRQRVQWKIESRRGFRKALPLCALLLWKSELMAWQPEASVALLAALLWLFVADVRPPTLVSARVLPAIGGSDPRGIKWRIEAFQTATLFAALSESAPAQYLVVLSALPYFLGAAEAATQSYAKGRPVRVARNALVAFNKLLLVYLAWPDVASLLAVAVSFFYDLAALLVQLAIALCIAVNDNVRAAVGAAAGARRPSCGTSSRGRAPAQASTRRKARPPSN